MTNINSVDLKEFSEDVDGLVNLTASLEAAKEALTERSKELAEKYAEHHTLSLKAAQFKKAAAMIYKDNVSEERAKVEELFDIVESLKEI